ncbi:rhodanese-like domain-containing protein [Oceanispirochaeta sp.]|jgi:phage shock protein E|uniref:rhodanese-like domain-containing protein n=1 Tax=Oceanispirochaeta sp. TaxID=2035350 RepID=UPI00261004FE|nr:rhodanese-like domain-containing protein [Oceanispirochaeta sp.]MDA3957698.1 rhodanese-like domain-containing protein [Oceanispirochaeta sp.]
MKKTLILFLLMSVITGFAAAESMDYKDPGNLKALLESDRSDYLFLDVRTDAEYAAGHIPSSINIPYDTLPKALPEGTEKDQLIILYCRSGNRSGVGTRALVRAGYTNVQDFGGISRWRGPLEK